MAFQIVFLSRLHKNTYSIYRNTLYMSQSISVVPTYESLYSSRVRSILKNLFKAKRERNKI